VRQRGTGLRYRGSPDKNIGNVFCCIKEAKLLVGLRVKSAPAIPRKALNVERRGGKGL